MTDSKVSPAPIETDDQRRTFEFLCPRVTSSAELLQFHAVDGMIRDLRERRLAENKRIMDMENLWEARKAELEPQLQAMVAAAVATGAGKSAQTMLASTFTKDREDHVLLPQGPEEVDEIIDWTEDLDPDDNFALAPGDYEMFPQWTKQGAERMKAFVLDRARAGLSLPPGVVVTPGGKTVVTRMRTSPRLSPQQILAQRGDLDRLVSLEPQENQDDQ